MELYWKAAAAALITAVLILTVSKQEKDISALLAMAGCCFLGWAAVCYLQPVLDFIRELSALSNIQGELLIVLLKAVGIALVSETAGLLCADAGGGSLGKLLQLTGCAVILFLSIPVFRQLLTLIQEILVEL